MKRSSLIMRNLLFAVIVAGTLAAAPPQAAPQGSAPLASANSNQALVTKYCATWHNAKLKTASIAFDTMDLAHPEKNALTWERAIRKLRGGMMPPPGAPRPPVESVNAFATYLEDSLDKASAAHLDPG